MYSSNYIGSAIKADKFLFFLQEKLNKVIVSNYSGKTQKFISYLLLNKRDREINPVIEDFRELSIVHLIVISGFHMNLVKNILSKIIPNCLNPKIKKILIFSSLFTYSWATAFSIPSTRIFFEESSELFQRKKNKKGKSLPFEKWSKSIWITFLLFPSALSSLSFILSYFFALVFRLIGKLGLTSVNELLLRTVSACLISLFFFSYKTKKLFLISGVNQFLFTPVIILLFLYYFFTWPFKFLSSIGTKLYDYFTSLVSPLSFNKLYLTRYSGSSLEIFYFLVAFSLVTLGVSYLLRKKAN
ncbi:ComEC/Rec2 family competence protein [Mycoplasma suis]|nr:ComEC/Rec2 family competence protein [Mycoplasma suis]